MNIVLPVAEKIKDNKALFSFRETFRIAVNSNFLFLQGLYLLLY